MRIKIRKAVDLVIPVAVNNFDASNESVSKCETVIRIAFCGGYTVCGII